MSGCNGCLVRVDGAPVSGAAAGWNHIYTIDWRAAFTELGAVDLNSAGATLTFQGVTWETPSVANTGVNQVVSGTWALAAGGLVITGAGGGSVIANGPTFPHIFTNLNDLGNNTAAPFEPDPTRKYLLQAFISATDADANGEESGVGLYKINGIPAGGFSTTWVTFGANGLATDVPSMLAGNSGTPTRINRTDLVAPLQDCPTIHYVGTGKAIDAYAASFSAGSDFPSNDTLRLIASYGETTEVDNDTPGDPFVGWRAVLGHGGTGFAATIQQFRICQL